MSVHRHSFQIKTNPIGVEIDKSQASSCAIRIAKSGDIDALVHTCRDSFPDDVIWQVPKFVARNRWKRILSSAVAETWVYLRDSQVVAFVTLVRDITTYQQEKRLQGGGPVFKACAYLVCPKLCLQKAARKIGLFIRRSKTRNSAFDEKVILKNCTWIEPIAVSPSMRGRGIGRKLLEHCKERTCQLQIDGIKLNIYPTNLEARKFYERCGFVCTRRGIHTDRYILKLSRPPSASKTEEA